MPRIKELDYLKGILILLVVAFHLVYFSELYPYAKRVVYTFHMPAFLLISGYLMNFEKAGKSFCATMLWLAVPYLIMEGGYIIMAAILPIREHIEHLTPAVFLDKLLLHPIGPYWYLQTLVICGILWRLLLRLERLHLVAKVLLFCGILYLCKDFEIVTPTCGYYFLAGALMRNKKVDFTLLFKGRLISPILFAILICIETNLYKTNPLSILIVYTFISSCMYAFEKLENHGGRITQMLKFIGRNTLTIYLFSPIFTILCKHLVPLVSFDPTGLIFLILSLLICATGSLAIARMLELLGISKWIFGRKELIIWS